MQLCRPDPISRTVASEGVTVLLVEQNAKLALEVSQRGYVMESGLITLTAASAALINDPQVRQAYLGEWRSCGEAA